MTRTMTALALAGAIALGLAARPARAADYAAVFDKIVATVEQNFYDPGLRGLDWKAVGQRHRARLPTIRDDAGFKALVDQLLGELKVSHASIAPPAAAREQQRGIGASFAPVDGAETVVAVSPLSDAWRQGLRPGDQLLSPRDAVPGTAGSKAQLKIRDCAGRQRQLAVNRMVLGWPADLPNWRWSRFAPRSGVELGYLRIDRFDDGAAGLADQAMAGLASTRGLIIDLRNNSGGNTSALRLASYFLPPGETPLLALFARSYLQPLGRAPRAEDVRSGPKVQAYTDELVFKALGEHGGAAVFYSDALDGKRYAGKVVVLTGAGTASAAEGFSWVLRQHSHVRFIGRRSAGELLSGEAFDVGAGWSLTLPVHGLWGADGRDLADQPITPDPHVAWKRSDYCSGRDPDLEAAQDWLLAELGGNGVH